MSTIRSHESMYLRHESGATHELRGRNFKKLRTAVLAGRGQPEMVKLIENGYSAYLADDGEEYDIDSITTDTFKEG